MDYNTAIENVFEVFYDGNAHSRMLNGAQLNRGVGATGLIRADGQGRQEQQMPEVGHKSRKRGGAFLVPCPSFEHHLRFICGFR